VPLGLVRVAGLLVVLVFPPGLVVLVVVPVLVVERVLPVLVVVVVVPPLVPVFVVLVVVDVPEFVVPVLVMPLDVELVVFIMLFDELVLRVILTLTLVSVEQLPPTSASVKIADNVNVLLIEISPVSFGWRNFGNKITTLLLSKLYSREKFGNVMFSRLQFA